MGSTILWNTSLPVFGGGGGGEGGGEEGGFFPNLYCIIKQEKLGDVVYVELPSVGDELGKGGILINSVPIEGCVTSHSTSPLALAPSPLNEGCRNLKHLL